VHFFAKNQDLTNLQDRLGAALQNCGTAQGFCKIAARLRAPPNCQALYSCSARPELLDQDGAPRVMSSLEQLQAREAELRSAFPSFIWRQRST